MKNEGNIKFLKEVIVSVAGQNGAKIVDLLYDKKNVNEFLISKKLGLTINQTRNILYKLGDEGLVSFSRKKDRKKGGWYIYFWTLNSGKSLIKFRDKIIAETDNIKQRLELRKSKQFFYCENDDIEYTEDSALINGYICPECGEVLKLKDNKEEMDELSRKIVKSETILREVNKEVEGVMASEEKVRGRKLRAEEKKKEKLRLQKKLEKEKLRKREKKKLEKKSRKKKR